MTKNTSIQLGLDLGTNSIGWALVRKDSKQKDEILGLGTRVIPMPQNILSDFERGNSYSQTKERTGYRGTRRMYQRSRLRRERLHRVLNILGWLPPHYADQIDFEKRRGQFIPNSDVKLNYRRSDSGAFEFIFQESFHDMVLDFNSKQYFGPVPKDWTIYYLRSKAISQKITTQELAWIILNFNQKRGYYQSRGEESDDQDNKQYYVLTGVDAKEMEEDKQGNKLYEITFDNGLKYSKYVKNPEAYIGRKNEFIVTTKELKNGDVKYSYKSVDSEQDWIAIKAKTEQDVAKSGLTVGQYIYQNLLVKPSQKIRGKLIRTIERSFYKKELVEILKCQAKHHQEFENLNLYKQCLEELYPRNEVHRNIALKKKSRFQYLFVDDIIFYHRPLKSQKSQKGNCPFEFRTYLQDGEKVQKALKVTSKSNPYFQEFRVLQWLSNLKIYNTTEVKNGIEADVTDRYLHDVTTWKSLCDFLLAKKDISEQQLLNFIKKNQKLSKEEISDLRWNYVQEKVYPMGETYAAIVARLKKVNGIDATSFLDTHTLYHLWHIIYSVTDHYAYQQALETFALRYQIDVVSFKEAFSQMPPFDSNYAAYSEKAIKKLLPLMRFGIAWSYDAIDQKTQDRIENILSGELDETIKDRVRAKAMALESAEDFQGLPLWLASYIVYDRHSEIGEIVKWNTPNAIDSYLRKFKQHSLNNPIVEQVIMETLRVVRDIWTQYGDGKTDFFDSIHVELGRDMKNPKSVRERMSKQNVERENTNMRVRKVLELLKAQGMHDIKPYSPSQQEKMKLYEEGVYQNPQSDFSKVTNEEILKIRKNSSPTRAEMERYKLWLDQGYISPYTGRSISLSKLFTTDYEIEHIIPQSRFFDNAFSNKVIAETQVNKDKSNMTGYEYIMHKGGQIVDGHQLLSLDAYELHVQQYFKHNASKAKKLLSEDVPEGFINRQMNDSRYIAKLVSRLMSNIVRKENEDSVNSTNMLTVPGTITAKLRRDWGLEDQWNALVAPRFQRLNNIRETDEFGYWDDKINAFRCTVPDEVRRGFSKKRIDHRHHALDALTIACLDRRHIQYLSSLNNEKIRHDLMPKLMTKNKHGHYTKTFLLPWSGFVTDARDALGSVITSIKKNKRIINKSSNYTWQWRDVKGKLKKVKVRQSKGNQWAIRKPLHKETVYGFVNEKAAKGKIYTSVRTPLSGINKLKHLSQIQGGSVKKIILNHLERYKDAQGKINFEEAMNQTGVEALNRDIVKLNDNKPHMPIYKVKIKEEGSRYPVGDNSHNKDKYVEAAKGTNLFFAIYWNEAKQKRVFKSIPLYEVIEHQKQVAHLPISERTEIPIDETIGSFLFALSPNDLVYVLRDEDENLNIESLDSNRIYKMVSCTGSECHFIPINISKEIIKNENGTNGKSERLLSQEDKKGQMIKNKCVKLIIDRIGNIKKIIKPKTI